MSDQAGNVLCLASGPGPEAGKVPTPCLWGGLQILAFLFEGIMKGRGSPNFLPQEVEEIEQSREREKKERTGQSVVSIFQNPKPRNHHMENVL